MNFGSFSSCSLCLCIEFDGVYNSHAVKLLHELFPGVETSENIIFCRDCSSLLDMFRNIKVLLTDNEEKFKQKESNELNIANFIMWSNGENNDLNEDKCHICSRSTDYGNLKSMGNEIILQVFPNLDPTFCSTIKLCNLCKNAMEDLRSFKMKYSVVKSELSIKIENTKYFKYTYEESLNKIGTDLEEYFKASQELYPDILYRCQTCNFKNKSIENIQTHRCKNDKSQDSSEKLYKCKLCPFRSNQKGNVKTHLLVHKSTEEINMYKCDQCKFQSRQKGNLKTHQLVHLPKDKIKMYKCSFCSFAARQKGNLKTHLSKKHKNETEVPLDEVLYMKCKICSFRTKKKKIFERHMDKHDNLS